MDVRRCRQEALLAVVGTLMPLAIAAQSYGTTSQVLTVGAAAFRGENVQPVFGADGYLYNSNPSAGVTNFFSTPLRLPNGAVITRFCASLRNEEASPSVTFAGINAIRMYPGGPDGGLPVAFVNPNFHSGYEEFCSDIPNSGYLVRNDYDFDGDGNSDHVSLRIRVGLPSGPTIGFGGVRISWHRQVSASPAQPTFGDVAVDHPFFQQIEALAASAITGGCGNGNFCPNGNLTRGQMAVFLAKALGLHWVN